MVLSLERVNTTMSQAVTTMAISQAGKIGPQTQPIEERRGP